MYFSDDSFIYEPTDSGDERIERSLKQDKEEENRKKKQEDLRRKEEFEEAFREQEYDIFRLPGLTFLKFTHLKIKFSFVPSRIRYYISKKYIFYCSLKYYEKYKIWNVRRDSFPVNFKWRIYRLFYAGNKFIIDDDSLLFTIFKIYEQLVQWAKVEDAYRLDRFMSFQHGEDIILDSDDEELFLNEDEIRELHEKREEIWKRMLPPG